MFSAKNDKQLRKINVFIENGPKTPGKSMSSAKNDEIQRKSTDNQQKIHRKSRKYIKSKENPRLKYNVVFYYHLLFWVRRIFKITEECTLFYSKFFRKCIFVAKIDITLS